MTDARPITLTLDRRLLEHPRAYHLRRMRAGLWLYLDLLARLPSGADTFEVEPAAVGRDMGLPEGTIRSWLEAVRLNGVTRVTIKRATVFEAAAATLPAQPVRFFTVLKLQRALGEKDNDDVLQAALGSHADEIIKRALAGTLAVPETQIRRSRTALFIYLLKRHAPHE
jgi:hypothetical protein